MRGGRESREELSQIFGLDHEMRDRRDDLISHVDGWKEKHGDCLRANSAAGPESVFVEHLQRWRYHADHVVGQNAMGYFIFNERRLG